MSKYVVKTMWGMMLLALIVSAVAPYERSTWWMEVAPIFIITPLLWWTRKSFRLTSLLLGLIALHSLVLSIGGTYTHARVPFGFYLQDAFHLSRNPYDKIGHFMQGFVPALAARELLIRHRWVLNTRVAAFMGVCVAMTVSAVYELIEWWAALLLGQGADAFLGTQGDVWDTQSDMFFALIGSTLAMCLFSRWQDRQITRLRGV